MSNPEASEAVRGRVADESGMGRFICATKVLMITKWLRAVGGLPAAGHACVEDATRTAWTLIARYSLPAGAAATAAALPGSTGGRPGNQRHTSGPEPHRGWGRNGLLPEQLAAAFRSASTFLAR